MGFWSGFLGLHIYSALRSRALDRDLRQRMGELRYMSVYSVLSFGFLGLIILGYRNVPDGPMLWVGGNLVKILLMGGFALYSVVSVFSAFRRGERVTAAAQWGGDAPALAGGLAITSAMLYLGHGHIL